MGWEWGLGIQPRELAVPRREATTSVLVGAVLGATLTLLVTGDGDAAWFSLVGIAGPGIGYAEWRWIRWRRGGVGRWDPAWSIVLAVSFAWLAVAGPTGTSPSLWASLAFFSACLVPAAFRARREHPPRGGWFPGPTGRFRARWWERAAWTDRVLLDGDGAEAIDPAGAPPTTVANAPRRGEAPHEPVPLTRGARR